MTNRTLKPATASKLSRHPLRCLDSNIGPSRRPPVRQRTAKTPLATTHPINQNGRRRSHIELIYEAISNAPKSRLLLDDVYQRISDAYPCYHYRDEGWRRVIRNRLSRHFLRAKRPNKKPGEGDYWKIDPGKQFRFLKKDRTFAPATQNSSTLSIRLKPSGPVPDATPEPTLPPSSPRHRASLIRHTSPAALSTSSRSSAASNTTSSNTLRDDSRNEDADDYVAAGLTLAPVQASPPRPVSTFVEAQGLVSLVPYMAKSESPVSPIPKAFQPGCAEEAIAHLRNLSTRSTTEPQTPCQSSLASFSPRLATEGQTPPSSACAGTMRTDSTDEALRMHRAMVAYMLRSPSVRAKDLLRSLPPSLPDGENNIFQDLRPLDHTLLGFG